MWPGAHIKPRARQVCFALCQLAAGFKVNAPTSLLSPYFKDIVQALLETVDLPLQLCTHMGVHGPVFLLLITFACQGMLCYATGPSHIASMLVLDRRFPSCAAWSSHSYRAAVLVAVTVFKVWHLL